MPRKRVSLSIGALLGNLDGVRLAGLMREKKKYIWVPFLDPEGIMILSLGAIWNFINYPTNAPCPFKAAPRNLNALYTLAKA